MGEPWRQPPGAAFRRLGWVARPGEGAEHLAAEGASVFVNYASSKTGAEQVVGEITAKGGKALAVQADVARKADIERLFAEMKKPFGALDILVNNAGLYENAPLGQITEEHFHRHFNLNVLGLILTTQEALNRHVTWTDPVIQFIGA